LSEGAGQIPLELLLLSLAGCSGQAVIGIMHWMEQPVASLEVKARGQRRDEYPTIFPSIELEFAVHGADIDPALVARAIKLSEERYCPVWTMLKAGTKIIPSFRIIESNPVPYLEY
jgi:putative redox protein